MRPHALRLGLLTILALATSAAWAQPAPGAIGLRANLQEGEQGIALPIWLSRNTIVFEPALALAHVSDGGTDLGVGAMLRFNLRDDALTPYFGFRVLGYFFSPDEGDGTTDFLFGPAFGGEYFFDPRFSISVEAQLNVTQSDERSGRFGNPDGTTISTGTAVAAAVYF